MIINIIFITFFVGIGMIFVGIHKTINNPLIHNFKELNEYYNDTKKYLSIAQFISNIIILMEFINLLIGFVGLFALSKGSLDWKEEALKESIGGMLMTAGGTFILAVILILASSIALNSLRKKRELFTEDLKGSINNTVWH